MAAVAGGLPALADGVPVLRAVEEQRGTLRMLDALKAELWSMSTGGG
jgi:hypothetical protein